MNETLFYILGNTFLISLISFVGALTLFLKEKLSNKILVILVAFSAGALIGGAFLHILSESIMEMALLLIPMLLLVQGHTHTHSHEHHKVEYEHLHEHYNEQEHDHEHHEHEHNHNYKNKLIVDIMNNKITWQAYQS